MKVLTIAAQKGGVGKTTIAAHLAWIAYLAGVKVAIVDLDEQASASKWADPRGDKAPDVFTTPSGLLPRTLEKLKAGGYELIIVDTPPSAGRAGIDGIKLADLVLVPTRVAKFDIEAVAPSYETAVSNRKEAYVLFNAFPPNGSQLDLDAASRQLAEAGIRLAPLKLHQRAAIWHATDRNLTVHEYEPGCKAQAELDALWAWVAGLLNFQTSKLAD